MLFRLSNRRCQASYDVQPEQRLQEQQESLAACGPDLRALATVS